MSQIMAAYGCRYALTGLVPLMDGQDVWVAVEPSMCNMRSDCWIIERACRSFIGLRKNLPSLITNRISRFCTFSNYCMAKAIFLCKGRALKLFRSVCFLLNVQTVLVCDVMRVIKACYIPTNRLCPVIIAAVIAQTTKTVDTPSSGRGS